MFVDVTKQLMSVSQFLPHLHRSPLLKVPNVCIPVTGTFAVAAISTFLQRVSMVLETSSCPARTGGVSFDFFAKFAQPCRGHDLSTVEYLNTEIHDEHTDHVISTASIDWSKYTSDFFLTSFDQTLDDLASSTLRQLQFIKHSTFDFVWHLRVLVAMLPMLRRKTSAKTQ